MTATEQAIAPFQVAKVRPPMVKRGKAGMQLVRAGQLGIGVQVASTDGGETNLHAHPGMDSAWMVLGGRAKFYTVNDRVVGELGKNEIISIPAGTPYWFEAADDAEPLVVLHITSRAKDHQGSTRIDYTPRTAGGENRIREVIPDAFFES